MSEKSIAVSENIEILKREERRTFERVARYTLYRLSLEGGEYYAVEIVCGDERALAVSGGERGSARELFGAILRGAVMPCQLADVMYDEANKIYC